MYTAEGERNCRCRRRCAAALHTTTPRPTTQCGGNEEKHPDTMLQAPATKDCTTRRCPPNQIRSNESPHICRTRQGGEAVRYKLCGSLILSLKA